MPLGARLSQRARKSERKTAAQMGGRTQPASGATWHSKGDVKTKAHLVEQKDTNAGSYTLRLVDLEKIRGQAVLEGREPVFSIVFNGYGQRQQFAVIPWGTFLELTSGSD